MPAQGLERLGVARHGDGGLRVAGVARAGGGRGCLRRLESGVESLRIAGQSGKFAGVGGHRRQCCRIAGKSSEVRIPRKGHEIRVLGHDFEGVGLHQLRNRRVTQSDITLTHLARDIAFGGGDGALARSERRINAAQAIGANGDDGDQRSRHEIFTVMGNSGGHDDPPCAQSKRRIVYQILTRVNVRPFGGAAQIPVFSRFWAATELQKISDYNASTMVTLAIPPPSHMV